MSNTSRLVKLFTVLGPGFHAALLFAVFITSCVALTATYKHKKFFFDASGSEAYITLYDACSEHFS